MSKNTNHIDQLFKNTLEGHQVKAPAHIKSNVLKGISKSNFWTWAAAIVSISGIAACAIFLFSPEPSSLQLYKNRTQILQLDPTPTIINSITEEPSAQKLSANTFVQPQHKVLENKSQKQVGKNTTEKAIPKASANEAAIQLNKKANEVVANKKVTVKTKEAPIIAQEVKIAHKIVEEKTDLADATTTLTNDSQQDIFEHHAAPSKTDIQSAEKEKLDPVKTPLPEVTENSSNPALEQSVLLDTSKAIKPLPNTSTNAELDNSMIAENEIDSTQKIDSITTEEIIIEDVVSPQKNKFFISAIGGPSINNTNYGKNELSSTLANAHVEKIGYFAQIKGVYSINSKLFTEVGLGFEQQSYNTSFKINTTSYNVNENEEFDYFIYDTTNQYIIDTIYKTTYDTTTVKGVMSEFGKVQIQYAQIPLYFGYQFEKNKWLFHLKAGVQLNYLLNQKGTFYQNNEIIDIDQNNNILKKLVFNYNLGVSAHYNLMQDLYLSGQLNYQIGVQNYYKTDYGTRSNNSLSFGIGLGYRF